MVRAGCIPGVNYFRWSSDFDGEDGWFERDEILDEFVNLMLDNAEPQRWNEMDEAELEHYYAMLMEIKKDG